MSPVKKMDEVEACTLNEFQNMHFINLESLKTVKTHHARGFVHIRSMFMFGRVKSFSTAFGMAFFAHGWTLQFWLKVAGCDAAPIPVPGKPGWALAPCFQAGIPAPRHTKSTVSKNVIEKDS